MDVCFQGHANAVLQSFSSDISISSLGCSSRRLASWYASAAAALRGLPLRVLLRLCAFASASCSRLCIGLARCLWSRFFASAVRACLARGSLSRSSRQCRASFVSGERAA